MYAYFKKLDYFSTECIYSPNAYRWADLTYRVIHLIECRKNTLVTCEKDFFLESSGRLCSTYVTRYMDLGFVLLQYDQEIPPAKCKRLDFYAAFIKNISGYVVCQKT